MSHFYYLTVLLMAGVIIAMAFFLYKYAVRSKTLDSEMEILRRQINSERDQIQEFESVQGSGEFFFAIESPPGTYKIRLDFRRLSTGEYAVEVHDPERVGSINFADADIEEEDNSIRVIRL